MKTAPDIDELTSEYVMHLGQEWIESVLNATPVDEIVKRVPLNTRIPGG